MTAKPGTTSTADRILDAAIGLMNTKGYNPVSVREIAKAVGLSEMTVFRHFPSKYAMLMAAMRRAPYAEMIEDVFTTHVRWELEHDLRHFMRRYMDIAEQRIGIWRIYFSAIGQIDEHSTELVSDVTSFRERLRAYFEEMIRRGHIRQLDSLYVSSLFWNLIFGFVGDKVGWRNTIIWFGGVGCGITTLLFYYSPQFSAGNFWVVMAAGVLWGALLAGYVPLSALMPSLVKKDKGAAVSVLNLGAGLPVFVGPAIVGVFYRLVGGEGVVWILAGLYLFGAFLTKFITLPGNAKTV